MDLPRTIAQPVNHELVVRKSRFLAHLAPAYTIAEASAVLTQRRKELWNARHHCVALILGSHGNQTRSSDDGEPSGTAGMPMLEVLRRRGITDLVAVVSRYFGGVKLGTGGLARAYSNAVSTALDTAHAEGVMLRREVLREVEVPVPHADAGRIDNMLRDWAASCGSVMEAPTYNTVAHLRLLVPPDRLGAVVTELASASAGTLTPIYGELRVIDVPETAHPAP